MTLYSAQTATELEIAYADVLNRGLSGYNTTWALLAMKKVQPPTTRFSGQQQACLP